MTIVDHRRRVPRTDAMLKDPRLAAAADRLGRTTVKAAIAGAQARARAGELDPAHVADAAVEALPATAGGLRRVLNATGVILHTNLGRAALSPAAVEAVMTASGHTDVELDLATGRRARRGRDALGALAAAVPDAGAVHVVNNGAAALVLVATVLAAGREIVVSRGEMVEIGDGFRLPDLLESTGARLREVGTTNRTSAADYRAVLGPSTGFVLKVHPSNFVVRGFTGEASVRELSEFDVPLVVDIGSGLLAPDPLLPDEPDAASTLRAGANLVVASGDKLLGGPQAGLLFGDATLVERLRRHPLARALRVDKLTLAALQATITGPVNPTWEALRADPATLRERAEALRARLTAAGIEAGLTASEAVVGGGGAPDLTLASWSISLREGYAVSLRLGSPAVVGRVERGRLLLDLRCVPASCDGELEQAVLAASRVTASPTSSPVASPPAGPLSAACPPVASPPAGPLSAACPPVASPPAGPSSAVRPPARS
ncbi:L-seryl-tRNA(Sec) selenium transferase [Actinoplanes sp. NPDC051861]|uniref:L-seryl-tRNA(Sec) selenium transferase n=1 Tax=Actinoplanes sp. NPDC051861 TaxID=3155170 RepID=UPI003443A2EC